MDPKRTKRELDADAEGLITRVQVDAVIDEPDVLIINGQRYVREAAAEECIKNLKHIWSVETEMMKQMQQAYAKAVEDKMQEIRQRWAAIVGSRSL